MVILWSSFLLDMLKYSRGGWWCPKCLPHTVNNHNEARDCIERREQWSIYTENATEEHETAAADRTHRTSLKTTRTWGQTLPKLLGGSEDTKGRGPNVLGVKPTTFNEPESSHQAAVWVMEREASSLSQPWQPRLPQRSYTLPSCGRVAIGTVQARHGNSSILSVVRRTPPTS